jgi:hypothetical protein
MTRARAVPAASGFRFRPPALTVSPESEWTLYRAFGPLDAEPPVSFVAELAFDQAARLGLASRVASRVPRRELARQLGEREAERFAATLRSTAARTLRYEQLAADICEVAQELGFPVVFLKGMALHLAEACPLGSRELADLDLLTLGTVAEPLWQALVDRGMRPAPGAANEQHLPPLQSAVWGVVDVHFALHGLWRNAEGWWTAEALFAAGLVQRTAAISGGHVPAREVLAAHCLAHGIEQHGLAPGRHGLLRMLGDVQDLSPDTETWRSVLDACGAWLAPSVSLLELEAVHELRLALEGGRLPEPGGVEGRLLSHFLAAETDEAYRRSLRARNLRWRLRRALREGRLVRYMLRKLPGRWTRGTPHR